MQVMIKGQSVTLRSESLLGVGAEAQVFRWGDRAVKIYHSPQATTCDADRQTVQKLSDMRLAKVAQFPAGLPDSVLGPLALARRSRNGAVAGFVMRGIFDADELRRLTQPNWRTGFGPSVSTQTIFKQLHSVLGELHRRNVVVGDLNDTNILVEGGQPWLIDADSMQFGGFPCPVGHERTLAPELYGLDLSAAPRFSPATDWYAFAVLLFSSLLRVHPYGGVHPRYATLLRRAEANCSVMCPDVRYPKAATPYQVLPEPLLKHFRAVFDSGRRGQFPKALLDFSWTTCSCGLEHARRQCPRCRDSAPAAPQLVTRIHGRCRSVRAFSTSGRVVGASVQGGLRAFALEKSSIRRSDGSKLTLNYSPGLRVVASARTSWAGDGNTLISERDGHERTRVHCDRYGSEPAFDANSTSCFHVSGGWLLESSTGRRWGQVLENQTFIRVGEQVGFGLYRAGLVTVWFVFGTGRPGLRRVDLPSIRGRLLDVAATFDGDRILIETVVELDGRVTHTMTLIDESGGLRARFCGTADEHQFFSSVGHKAILGDRVLCPTDEGLISLQVDPVRQTYIESALFADTEPFVSAEAKLLVGPGGSIYVVNPKEIQHLTLFTKED